MELAKLTIYAESREDHFDREIEVLFNPNQIAIQKASNWQPKPKAESDVGELQFLRGERAILSLDLFFDTYTYEGGRDVRDYTKQIFALATVQEHGSLHRPPRCKLRWGSFNVSSQYDCEWVLKSLNQRFTLFVSTGTPVRATLTCTFWQWRSDELGAKVERKESADVAKTHTVRRGDTLSSIAFEQYGDPGLWRPIAEANGIDNPRILPPGKRLFVPTLRGPGGIQR